MMKNLFEKFAGVLGAALVAGCATQPTPVPPALADALARQGVGPKAHISYADENGQSMSAQDFMAQIAQSRKFAVGRARSDGDQDVTLYLRPAEEESFARLRVGQAWPAFRLTRLDGTPVDNKSLEGRYTLVDFYSAASGRTLADVALLNAVAERYKELNLLAVTEDSAADARTFVDNHRFTWPVATGAGELVRELGIGTVPSLALFDPQGKLVVAAKKLNDPDAFFAWVGRRIGAVPPPPQNPHEKAAVIDFTTCSRPAYPPGEVRERHTGKVRLNFLVGVDGKMKKAEIASSSGYPELDQAALAALSTCRFRPATRDGAAIEKWSPVIYEWSLG
jgi:TonB family protein